MTAIASARLGLGVGGHRLEALRLDPPATSAGGAPTLVFLHEGLGSIGFWKDFPQRLCAETGLGGFVFDRLGHGGSDPAPGPRGVDYLDREAVDRLPAVLAAAGIEHPILIGHSDGGTIALLHAAAFPTVAMGIVTLAAHVFVEEVTLVGIRRAVAMYEREGLRERLARYHGERTEAVFRAWADTWLSPAFRSWNVEAVLPRIVAPVLVMQGRDDEYGSLAQVEAIAAGVGGPVERCILEDCGHVPHHQARAATLASIRAFVARIVES